MFITAMSTTLPKSLLDVKIDIVSERRGKYVLFYTHFKDEQIPHVWHHLNEVQRTNALHDFLDTHNA
jgi:hypothetical protein